MSDETKKEPGAVERLCEEVDVLLQGAAPGLYLCMCPGGEQPCRNCRAAATLREVREQGPWCRAVDADTAARVHNANLLEIDSLKARLDEMEKALRTFGRHNWDCKFMRYPIYDACSCGWDEIRILINKS
jgi:hypothetical protein